MTLSDLQFRIIKIMHFYDENSGKTRSYSAVDIKDRGLDETIISGIGTSMKSLTKKEYLEMTQHPTARGNKPAKYKLTSKGKKLIKSLLDS